MTISASHAVLFTGICLLAGSPVLADEPGSTTLPMVALPSQQTPVYVWPIMRGCRPDKPATDAVVRRLTSDLRLQVHRLSIPEDPTFLGCQGVGCAELLKSQGCSERSGILVGGEVDEAPCDANDKSLAGCTGQLLSRVRVFRIDLEKNQPTQGDYRYALCQDRRCGAEAYSVEETTSQLVEELVGTQSLPSPPAAPRISPQPPEYADKCTPGPTVVTGTARDLSAQPAAQPELSGKAVVFAHYTQYKRLDRSVDGKTQSLTRGQAEQEATARGTHFTSGVTLPAGPQYITSTVNSKYALLPGETLIGNFWRATTLHGYLTAPPAGSAYEPLRQVATDHRLMIVLVLDDQTRSLDVFLIEPNKALRQVASPAACQAGGGDGADCVSAAIGAALVASAQDAPRETAHPVSIQVAQRPLECIPYAARSCSGCGVTPAVASAAAPLPLLPPEEPTQSHKWTDRLLYAALGVAVITAGSLTVADSLIAPAVLTDSIGESASINGLLRPAQWTAWGLAIALAIPTAVSVIENGRSRPHETAPIKSVAQPSGPRCPISDAH